jgi:hypothetical protein
VRVTVTAGGLTPLVREGSGAGHGNRFAEAQGLRRGPGPGPRIRPQGSRDRRHVAAGPRSGSGH